jgi:hypothetical protein
VLGPGVLDGAPGRRGYHEWQVDAI